MSTTSCSTSPTDGGRRGDRCGGDGGVGIGRGHRAADDEASARPAERAAHVPGGDPAGRHPVDHGRLHRVGPVFPARGRDGPAAHDARGLGERPPVDKLRRGPRARSCSPGTLWCACRCREEATGPPRTGSAASPLRVPPSTAQFEPSPPRVAATRHRGRLRRRLPPSRRSPPPRCQSRQTSLGRGRSGGGPRPSTCLRRDRSSCTRRSPGPAGTGDERQPAAPGSWGSEGPRLPLDPPCALKIPSGRAEADGRRLSWSAPPWVRDWARRRRAWAATWTGILFVAESCPPGTTISSVGTSSLVVFALTVVGWFKIR